MAGYHGGMIARIEGQLDSIESGAALVRCPVGLVYEVLVPTYVAARLGPRIGEQVTFFTLHYLEGQAQGATMLPRLAGFLTQEDKAFFELFTTCKGIGNRKALRAMALPAGQIAGAISDRDVALLQTLPEIGKRSAETIIATLSGKVDRFVTGHTDDEQPAPAAKGKAGKAATSATARDGGSSGTLRKDGLAVLLNMGLTRLEAMDLIDRVLSDPDSRPADSGELITLALALRSEG